MSADKIWVEKCGGTHVLVDLESTVRPATRIEAALGDQIESLQAQLDKVRGVKQYDGHIYDNRLRVPTVVVRYDDLQQALQESE